MVGAPHRFHDRIFYWALALALLVHLAIFPLPVSWRAAPRQALEVISMDQPQVDRIRESIAREHSKEPSNIFVPSTPLPRAEKAPEDARYGADQNIRVEKEQRARSGGVLPGHSGEDRLRQYKPRTKPLWAPPDPNGIQRQELSEPSSDSTRKRGAQEQSVLEDLPEGTETLLNARESVYYSFYLRIRESVGLLWESLTHEAVASIQLQPGEYQTLVEVVLDSSGNLLDLDILESSGYPALDRAVEESWRRVKKFPNPPRGLLESDGRIRLKWTFSVEMGKGSVHFMPPGQQ